MHPVMKHKQTSKSRGNASNEEGKDDCRTSCFSGNLACHDVDTGAKGAANAYEKGKKHPFSSVHDGPDQSM